MKSDSVQGSLAGRDGEVARLRGLMADVAGGRGGSVWVEGEPGIGKSALPGAGLAEAGGSGCLVLSAAADEVGGRFPLRVLLECFRGRPRSTDEVYRQVAGLLRGEDGGDLAAPADAAVMAAERLVDVVERLCVISPVVLVADDLQWAR